MTAAILTILAALAPVVAWLIMRRLRARGTPEQKRDEIHKVIADGDTDVVNVLLDDAVRRNPRLPDGASDSSGPSGNPS